jgi:uncharacterized protein YjiS (DUF1127 family)
MKTIPLLNGIEDMPAVGSALALAEPGFIAAVGRRVRRLLHRLRAMREAAAGRRALAVMDARMFADIGISHGDAVFEMNRKLWNTAPSPVSRCR